MGGYFSTEINNDQLKNLHERLEKIEQIDLDGDGIISKNEFEKWRNDIEHKYEEKVDNLQNTLRNLHNEVDTLKNVNEELENTLLDKNALIQRLGANIETDSDVKELVNMLSKEQINMYVEELLANEETNIKYLPDVVERQLYRNVFRLAIKILNKIMSSMSFELINHKMNINMIPNIGVDEKDAI